jgi:hypothetical protein
MPLTTDTDTVSHSAAPGVPPRVAVQLPPRDVSAVVAALQAQRFRQMTPDMKLAQADALHDLAVNAAAAGIRMRQPYLSAVEVQLQVRELFQRAAK